MYLRFFWILPALPSFSLVGITAFIIVLVTSNLVLAIAIGIIAGLLAVLLLLVFSKSIIASKAKVGKLNRKLDTRFKVKVDSLCLVHGFETPKLCIIKSPEINALAFGLRKSRATLAITYGTHKNLNSVELEGVLAHELSRIRLGITSRETYVIALLKIPFKNLFNKLHEKLITADTVMAADIDGMKMTRYPPGLIAALNIINQQDESEHIPRDLSIIRFGKERLPVLQEFWGINTQ